MIRTNKEQKTALSFLIISRFFERLAFYLIMAIFIFYLSETFKLDADKAGKFYSIFYKSIGISALLFGLLGDFVNRQKVVKLGMLFTTIFYLVLIFLPVNYMLQLTIFIFLGVSLGSTISNSTVFLGNIYNEQKMQIYGLSGFIFYSLAISFGALFASPLSNAFKETIGYTPIFILAFISAIISFALYLVFDKTYSKLEIFADQRGNTEPQYKNLNLTILISIFIVGLIIKAVLFQKSLFLSFYIRNFSENGSELYSILHGFDKIVSLLLLLIFGIIVVKFKKTNWQKLLKLIMIGIVIGSLVYIFFAYSDSIFKEKISQALTLNLYAILLIAETLIYSVTFYIIYRTSPIKFKGLFQGLFILLNSFNMKTAFLVSSVSENTEPSIIFIVFSLLLILSAILIFILMKFVERKENVLNEN